MTLPEQRFHILQISCGTAGKHLRIPAFTLWTVLSLLSLGRPLLAQTTVGTGSSVGTVSDPSDSVQIDGTTYEHDVNTVIAQRRKKKPSKKFCELATLLESKP